MSVQNKCKKIALNKVNEYKVNLIKETAKKLLAQNGLRVCRGDFLRPKKRGKDTI